MKRIVVGTLIAGFCLMPFSPHSGPACLLAGFFATVLVLQLGPRSVAEKTGVLLTAAAIAWLAGPRAALHESLFLHFFAWLAAGTAVSVYLHPRAE